MTRQEQARLASLSPKALRAEEEAVTERLQQTLKALIILEAGVMEMLDSAIAAVPRSYSE